MIGGDLLDRLRGHHAAVDQPRERALEGDHAEVAPRLDRGRQRVEVALAYDRCHRVSHRDELDRDRSPTIASRQQILRDDRAQRAGELIANLALLEFVKVTLTAPEVP